MKERLLKKLSKNDMRAALSELGVDKLDKKPLDKLRFELRKFSYREIVEALKL